MQTFLIKCYPGSESETNLIIRIGKMTEIAPNDKNYDPETTYGYDISVDRKGCLGISHHGFKDLHKTQASAMLRAVSYGNGGFPLETMLL